MKKVRKTTIDTLASHLQSDTIIHLIKEWESAGYNKKDCKPVAELYETYKHLTGHEAKIL